MTVIIPKYADETDEAYEARKAEMLRALSSASIRSLHDRLPRVEDATPAPYHGPTWITAPRSPAGTSLPWNLSAVPPAVKVAL